MIAHHSFFLTRSVNSTVRTEKKESGVTANYTEAAAEGFSHAPKGGPQVKSI